MIEKITIKNFKSFRDVSVKLGPLNIFIGPNAGGKSNFFDALRVLQGIGYGFTLREILDGKPKSATSEVWEGIRGGTTGATFARDGVGKPTAFRLAGALPSPPSKDFEFAITFRAEEGRFGEERLCVSDAPVYEVGWAREHRPFPPVQLYDQVMSFTDADEHYPTLTQLNQRARQLSQEGSELPVNGLSCLLTDMQHFDPIPSLLREYSKAYEIKRMGERGENFAALVRMICSDPEMKEAYLNWLRAMRPREVDDVGVLKGALGEPMVMMKEGGREWPAPVLSDGTLRFAAIAAAFFQPDMPGLITIEDIDNGIHASRLRLLVELLRSRAGAGNTQVIVTTHSPLVLAWLRPEEYATTFYCKRDQETGESRIVPLSEVPRFMEIVNKQPISDLFAEGWLEAAL